jgi:hypothetical protein
MTRVTGDAMFSVDTLLPEFDRLAEFSRLTKMTLDADYHLLPGRMDLL